VAADLCEAQLLLVDHCVDQADAIHHHGVLEGVDCGLRPQSGFSTASSDEVVDDLRNERSSHQLLPSPVNGCDPFGNCPLCLGPGLFDSLDCFQQPVGTQNGTPRTFTFAHRQRQ
jgi:hypothetical protein